MARGKKRVKEIILYVNQSEAFGKIGLEGNDPGLRQSISNSFTFLDTSADYDRIN
jgi:hypothetical protein